MLILSGSAWWTFEQTKARPTPALSELLERIRARLDLATAVAKTKWNEGKAIADPAREEALLGQMAARGKKLGLDEALVRKVFRGQMEAGKLIQEYAFGRWKAEKAGKFEQVVELAKLRDRFDTISEDLLKALVEALPELEKITDRKELLGLAEPVFRGGILR